ncbi:MAG: S-adenosylmethionine:tRNA ribosyltransferase-isomerase, partial [Cyclobacteriaceae bacterium]
MLRLTDYTYDLPADRIALHPLPQRDASKLLVYRKGKIEHAQFKSLADYLPHNTLLLFNNTRVIRARLLFSKETGATIEVFLLHPLKPAPELALAMKARGESMWQCTIGNQKGWKENTELTLTTANIQLKAQLADRADRRRNGGRCPVGPAGGGSARSGRHRLFLLRRGGEHHRRGH